ncbi:MAG: hypothetical protein PHF74_06915 [Dehalococcoidales bacterium]|nr:hypothetical protein [Dehalococcoidales bacterium]
MIAIVNNSVPLWIRQAHHERLGFFSSVHPEPVEGSGVEINCYCFNVILEGVKRLKNLGRGIIELPVFSPDSSGNHNGVEINNGYNL